MKRHLHPLISCCFHWTSTMCASKCSASSLLSLKHRTRSPLTMLRHSEDSNGMDCWRTAFLTFTHSSSSAPYPTNLTRTSTSPKLVFLCAKKRATSYHAESFDDLASNCKSSNSGTLSVVSLGKSGESASSLFEILVSRAIFFLQKLKPLSQKLTHLVLRLKAFLQK